MAQQDLARRALFYARSQGISIEPNPFDGGEDGSVWHTDRHTVLKVFERQRNYGHELECYKRMKDAGVGKTIRDFNVPELVDFSDSQWAIEMGAVFPPFILDFGKAHLHDPKWPPHVLEEWSERMNEWWGEDVKRVRLLLAALRGLGIWYYDARPGNVMLER